MPRQTEWLHRITEIREAIDALPNDLLDRDTIALIFHCSGRQAQRISRRIGPYKAGNVHLVTREAILKWLDKMAESPVTRQEVIRFEKLTNSLQETRKYMRARQIKIKADQDVVEVEQLPPGVHLTPGRLEIEFEGMEQLLGRLMELAQIVMNDYHRMEALVGRSS